MKIGYNTNGLAHHRFADAIAFLADHGYQTIAITPDTNWLDPYQDAASLSRQLQDTARLLNRFEMQCVMESGARYLINPRKKHDPTLMDANPDRRAMRIDYLKRLLSMASELNATCFSFWSGRLDENISQQQADQRLADGIFEILPVAEKYKIPIAFEPEPGMYIQTLDDFTRLNQLIQNGWFQLTIDLGHLHCLGEAPIANKIREFATSMINIHIEDMKPGIHEHIMFGEGSIDFPPIFQALHDINYPFALCVELSRDSHRADQVVPKSADFLHRQMQLISKCN
ncbi:MAG: sugar phosphate isomerase/epimerase family protein [bacterium]